eukprot:1151829-Pelagomonas_calceolata.AAC.1
MACLASLNTCYHEVGYLGKGARKKKKRKTKYAKKILPPSIKEQEKHWLRRAVSPLHHKATQKRELMGIWRVIGSIQLQDLSVRLPHAVGCCGPQCGVVSTALRIV